ncbi:universal stress protein [Luteimicrobium sp. NPDC057192]|uniref:universal stress protein n=1 Tax=Luteimicrobium sp. NPDC057192 TaxID=3346042 RepID=UPI00362E64FB
MTVLLAYNLTPQGDAALRVAVGEAERRGTTLTLLTLSVPGADRSDGVDPDDELAHAREQLPAGLADAAVLRRDPDVLPAEAILDAVDQVSPEVVVLGARKRPDVGTFLLGTTTQRVLLDAPVPVLVVKGPR